MPQSVEGRINPFAQLKSRARSHHSQNALTLTGTVEDFLASRGKNTPLLGMELPGRVLLTMAAGQVAYEAPGD